MNIKLQLLLWKLFKRATYAIAAAFMFLIDSSFFIAYADDAKLMNNTSAVVKVKLGKCFILDVPSPVWDFRGERYVCLNIRDYTEQLVYNADFIEAVILVKKLQADTICVEQQRGEQVYFERFIAKEFKEVALGTGVKKMAYIVEDSSQDLSIAKEKYSAAIERESARFKAELCEKKKAQVIFYAPNKKDQKKSYSIEVPSNVWESEHKSTYVKVILRNEKDERIKFPLPYIRNVNISEGIWARNKRKETRCFAVKHENVQVGENIELFLEVHKLQEGQDSLWL